MSINTLITNLKNSALEFLGHDKGSIAITFAVSLIPVMLTAGIAVDYTRIAHTKGIIDEALDAAVLMSGRELADGKRVNASFRADFEKFFFANVDGRTNLVDSVSIQSFNANPATGKVTASAKSNIKMTFMGIIGKPTVDVTSESEARFSSKKVELTMMLDVTGSMGRQGKLAALKTAANNAIDILLPTSSTSNKVRIGLVPYSASVNVGNTVARKVSNRPGFRCVTERRANRFNDASYATTKVEGAGRYCPSQKVVPLSTNASTLKSTINSFRASGATAGHLGVTWSYYTLSPNWDNAWPSSPTPASYGDSRVQKIALLMTDGEFNTIYTGSTSAQFAVSTCADMKRR
ncbi:hypothetical protein MNBD_ALPHA03-319, partial [hydrothermal vent metagenome]